jgi:hypothetical protein
MRRRFEVFSALWLVAQIVLPFTPPFPICNLSDLLSRTQYHGAPLVPPHPRVDGDYAFAPPLATTAGRLRLVVVGPRDVANVVGVVPVRALNRLIPAAGNQRRLQIEPAVLRL